MSKINVLLDNNNIIIEKERIRKRATDKEMVDIKKLEYNKFVKSSIKITNEIDANKVFLIEKINVSNVDVDEDDLEKDSIILGVYSNNKNIFCFYGIATTFFEKVLHLYYKITSLNLNKRGLKIGFYAYLKNTCGLKIDDTYFAIGDKNIANLNINQYKVKLSKIKLLFSKNRYKIFVPMTKLLNNDILINSPIKINISINGDVKGYNLKIKRVSNKKYYYVPIRTTNYTNYILNIRRTNSGSLVMLKREKDSYEYTKRYKVLESKFMSCILYILGKIAKKIRRKNINLYYEKMSEKAEEGTFELCKVTQSRKNSKNFFIIDSNSQYYKNIKNNKFVIKKYSLKYYWLLYTGNNCIAVESPMHLNILRSNNKYLRKALYNKKFVFLQHGIIYMKSMLNSAFIVGKEAEPDYIVASSEIESDVICEQLKLRENQVFKTGLALYDHIKYNHITNNSEDNVMIMLTHKPYEEHLVDFKETSYYKNVLDVYNIVSKYVSKDKILIVPHPKVLPLIDDLEIKNNFWQGPISEILEKTKLLITDYSSVCFNSFYQGSGVIFYQPDLKTYESNCGELIPNDDEYIGYRTFSVEKLDELLKSNINNGVINIDNFRIDKFKKMYKIINEFNDGNNTRRIYELLVNNKII